MVGTTRGFDRFIAQKTVALTTYRRNGTPVPTPVNIVVDGDHAYFRTWSTTGKAKRLRNNPVVEIAPSTFGGTPQGEAMRARARLLSNEESRSARRALRRKYPLLQGIAVPLGHRLLRYRTQHYELTADPG
ncbi:MAG TPA: PPOX class F420-dependent oxidoreductase [Actinopolymorphaceae bacterium]|nr:PPOX class F420-dependent oxidoreductase [Actinopolymorphaceae bacterium]